MRKATIHHVHFVALGRTMISTDEQVMYGHVQVPLILCGRVYGCICVFVKW